MTRPSYKSGFAPRDFEPAYPHLWRGCVGAYAPLLGETGLMLRDWSGRRNRGVMNGFDANTSWVNSQHGKAILFDSVDDFVALETPPVSSFPITLCAWFKPTLVGPGESGSIAVISKTDTSFGSHYFGMRQREEYLEARSRAGGTGQSSIVSGLTTNWNHGVAVFRSATYRRAWLNGQPGTPSTATRNPVGTDAATFGYGYGVDMEFFFDGCIAEVQIYNRELSESEIRLLASRPGIMFEPRPRRSFAVQYDATVSTRLLQLRRRAVVC